MGCTPLHNACCNDHVEIARFLLDRGADPQARDDDGDLPSHGASEEIVQLLREYHTG
jgi:ankyrin repeat protein